jgi:hypothetical protein
MERVRARAERRKCWDIDRIRSEQGEYDLIGRACQQEKIVYDRLRSILIGACDGTYTQGAGMGR